MRTLTGDEIRICARGVRTCENEGGAIRFHRFGPDAYAYYAANEAWTIRAHCTAGVTLRFRTDSATVRIRGRFEGGIGRLPGSVDVTVRNHLVGSLVSEAETGPLAGTVALPEAGTSREVAVWLPHMRTFLLETLDLDPDAAFEPAPPAPVLLALGDSITQGMNAARPRLTYPAVAARLLGMDLFDYGVGGAVFAEESLPEPPVPDPARISVAYGTNDWSNGVGADRAGAYLARLRELYPSAPILFLEPLWRTTGDGPDAKPNRFGQTFAEYRDALRAAAGTVEGVRVAPWSRLLPPDEAFLADGVHPNPAGHLLYGMHLAHELQAL